MGVSPRSRWSNRDDSSYKEKITSKEWKAKSHNWGKSSGESSAAILLIGQAVSLVSLVMIYAGSDTSQIGHAEQYQTWILGGNALIVAMAFGLLSFLLLFRISISRKAPRRRRRFARFWLLLWSIAIISLV